ncbi:MAG: hypothetical protein Q8930_08735 [Bacillota bacterium]|nr:hypothetical protein [Bacillota bacterium]
MNTYFVIAKIQTSLKEHGTVPVVDIVLALIFFAILISLYLIFENKRYSILAVFIILLGLGSRMVMGFSPTIWASNTRTFIFMYFAFITCAVILYKVILDSKESKYIAYSSDAIGLIAVLSFLNLVV